MSDPPGEAASGSQADAANAVGIRDVALLSGVSKATVSRALNDRDGVKGATRSRVQEVARQLGYVPSQQARTLNRARSDMIGVIWRAGPFQADARQPFLHDLLAGLHMASVRTGHHLLLLSPRTDDGVDRFVHAALQHRLDGAIVMGFDADDPALCRLVQSGRPCVAVDVLVSGPKASHVTSDNRAGAAIAVHHLNDLGHRQIAAISGPLQVMPAAERLAGFRETAAGLGLAVPEGYVRDGDFSVQGGHQAMLALLALESPPTAVFVADEAMASGAMQAVAEAGLTLAHEISIVAFGGAGATAMQPSLTAVRQDYRAIGCAALTLLDDIIEAREWACPPRPEHVPVQLHVLGSTGAPRAAAAVESHVTS